MFLSRGGQITFRHNSVKRPCAQRDVNIVKRDMLQAIKAFLKQQRLIHKETIFHTSNYFENLHLKKSAQFNPVIHSQF